MTIKQILLAVLVALGFVPIAFANDSRYSIKEIKIEEYLVTDGVTSLIWQKSYSSNEKTWQEAMSYCENLDYAGKTDWRLPNKKELMSLVNYEIYNPASDFPDMPSVRFWSSSTNVARGYSGWILVFYNGHVNGSNKLARNYARCVRGGP